MAKTNKFTKSVLERLEQEAKQQPKAPKSTQPPPVISEPEPLPAVIEPIPIAEPAAEPAIEPKKTELPAVAAEIPPVKREEKPAPVSPGVDLSQFLRPDNRRTAQNKTFYLDQGVIDAVKAAAKKQKVAESKLVNDILRSVFGL